MTGALVVFVGLALLVIIVISRTAVVVPQQSAFVVERLGRYRATLDAGFHILLPFIDAIRYRHSLKEHAGEIPEQICITRDNVQVHVDGVLYLKVLDPERASYGVADYLFAITQLAQTALRSEIGKIDLDKTFESRTQINLEVVNELDKATEPWGIRQVADTIRMPGGFEAVQLRVAEQYIGQFGALAKAANTLVLPASVSDVGSMIALAMNVIGRRASAAGPPPAPQNA